MAKNKKDLFKSNLSVNRAKPTDTQIEKIAEEIAEEIAEDKPSKKLEGEKGFHIKFPLAAYQKLDDVSKETHIPKKYIIIEALKDYYEKNGH